MAELLETAGVAGMERAWAEAVAAVAARREADGPAPVGDGCPPPSAATPRGKALERMESAGLDVSALPCWPGVMAGMREDTLPGGRGWVLCGPVGTGKTARALLAARWSGVAYATARELYEGLAERGSSFWRAANLPSRPAGRRSRGSDLVIDHLGEEPERLGVFGVTRRPLREILLERLSRWPEARTYIATRLTPEALAARYGADVASRLAGACGWLVLAGPDRRKPKGGMKPDDF